MTLYNIIVSMCFVIPMVYTYQFKINVSNSMMSKVTNCQRINDTVHHCGSLISMFELLSYNRYSTDVFVQSGTYILNISYTLEDLHNIQIRSDASNPAIIKCRNNSYINTGVAFLRARGLSVDHLSIVGCGMNHTSTNYNRKKFISIRSALFVQNSTNISLASINIASSTGIGLLMYDTNGLVKIAKCIFTSNKLHSSSHKIVGGGGIDIEFTKCTPGLSLCDYVNPYNRDSRYIIDRCTFEGNAATYGNDYKGKEKDISIRTGGGLSLQFSGQASNNLFEIISSNFTSNSATTGGGLYVHSRHNTTHNHIKILSCSFTANIAYNEGGGLVIGHVIHQMGGHSKFNTYKIINCLFKHNQVLSGIGGGISGFGSREPENTKPTNHFEIHNSSFINNKAKFGSAIQINRQYHDSFTVGSIFVLVLNNCNFTSNNFYDNSSIGAVAMSGVSIHFLGYTHFINNTSTALIADGVAVEFGNNSVTVFQHNSGLHGGAISLIDGANIIVFPDSILIFQSNSAVEHGGAIYVELSTPFDYLLSHVCFIRYYLESIPPSKWETNFTFINNTAKQSNNNIFASTLQPCVRTYSGETKLFDNQPFYHFPNNSDTKISTLPATFKFLNDSNKICNIVLDKAFNLICSIVPGEIFDLPLALKDELGETIASAMFIASCTESQSPNVLLPYQFTNGTIQIAGTPNEICHLKLQTDTDYPDSTMVQITLLNCPPGLIYNVNKRKCQCVVSHTHQIPAITGCEISSLQAYYNIYYWIGYKSNDSMELIFGLCAYPYCYGDYVPNSQLLPRDANNTVLDEFVCGDRRRTGILCGQCIEGYSVMMNSPTSTCHKCKKVQLGFLYLTLSYILPVSIIFYVIMSYNVRMTTGVISAFLFFSQIIGSHNYYSSVKANTELPFTISNIVISIYSITNLDFFQHNAFSYCLFSNAGSVDILAFRLFLSFYPIFLILTYFLVRRYCTCQHRCFQNCRFSSRSVTHGVSAFLVLCFARINILAFRILRHTELFYMNGTSYKKMVHFQGNIEYFGEPLYNMYAVGSLLALVIIITIPTMILVLHPILINIAIYFEWGESKFVSLVNKLLLIYKLKPVLDTFQGDYKDKMHYFAGLHFFLYKIIFFCIVVMASTANVSRLYLLVTAYFLIISLIHVLAMPFKRFIDNAAYSLVYFIMIMTTTIEYHFFSTDNSPYELILIEILLSVLPLTCIVVYCLWKLYISVTTYWRKHKQKYSNVQTLVSATGYNCKSPDIYVAHACIYIYFITGYTYIYI